MKYLYTQYILLLIKWNVIQPPKDNELFPEFWNYVILNKIFTIPDRCPHCDSILWGRNCDNPSCSVGTVVKWFGRDYIVNKETRNIRYFFKKDYIIS